MSTLILIAGSGHCGTRWLASVLDAQPGVTFYHELRPKMTQTAWFTLADKAPSDQVYGEYWEHIREGLEQVNIGDANSWAPWQLPDVARIANVKVLYLVRNGIQQLYSLSMCSDVWRAHPFSMPAYNVWLRALWQAMNTPGPDYDDLSRWERLCLLVQANAIMPVQLAQQMELELVRLEDLTTDVDVLQAIAPGLSRETCREWQAKDINRKVNGDRSPAAIWAKWSADQRETFHRMCGGTMSMLGYEIPDGKED
jgi:hypothetical protein